MRKIIQITGIALGPLLIVLFLGFFFRTDDTRGFENALNEKYNGTGYESIMSAFAEKSAKPCATDGLGVTPAPFGVMVSYCDATWYLVMDRFLFHVSGPRITQEEAMAYLAVPNEMGANALLREMHRRFSEGMTSEPRDKALDPPGGTSFSVWRDFGEQTIFPGQILADMMLGDIRYVVAGQRNMNTPLLGLPSVDDPVFAGIFAHQGNGSWQVLLDITDTYSSSPFSSYLYLDPNVRDLFFADGEIYVDILDAGGAGSGEGNLLRLRYNEDAVEQIIMWESVGEMYYVPETFTVEGSWEKLE